MRRLPPFLIDLARFLPVATFEQLLRHYYHGNAEALHRDLRAAKAKGFIEVSTELVRPWEHFGTPIARFQVGERVLPAGHLAYQASRRWNSAPVPTLVIQATTTLAALQGGSVRAIATGHVSHELAVTELFLNKRLHDSSFEWSLVHSRPGTGVLPDAVVGSLAFEVIGRYGNASVAAKLTLAAVMNLEIW
jgi:hypothetical protein